VGGVLLNRDYSIVDTIKETVYRAERYRGRDMGFATIFLGGVRISTNVMTRDNERAVGTIVSKEVYDQVIGKGKDWVGRAFVVNDWYISSYTPIWDIDNRIIGMLYTGILEAKYRDMMMRTVLIFLGVTAIGMVIAFFVSFRLGQSIIRRIRILNQATVAIASGDLDYQLPPGRSSGFDMLDNAFNNMARSLKDRDDRLQKAFQRITITERLASLGQMAAGVAHEINNPLGGILLYSNLVMEEMKPGNPSRENMEKIIYQTERCKKIVQNLLDFARTPSGDMIPLSINDVIITSLNLVKDQSIFHGIEVKTELAEGLPRVMGDLSRLEEVFLNLFINATDAMSGRGTLTISSRLSSSGLLKISIADTGKGIDKAYLPHIFEPFFTTKDPGQGTGLGLSITYGIIQKHSGFIDVVSEPGRGTTFTITMPPVGDSSPAHAGRSQEGCAIG
jgi:two-component system NtrC family sensor kinase